MTCTREGRLAQGTGCESKRAADVCEKRPEWCERGRGEKEREERGGGGEREAGLPSCALSIIHDPTQGRPRRAEVTGRDEGGSGVSGFFFRLMENKSKRDK